MRTVQTVRLCVLCCLLLIISLKPGAQSLSFGNGKVELGVGIGPMFFLGDLGGSKGMGKTFVKDLDFPLTKINKGIYLNIYPAEWIGFRIAGNLGYIEGDDAQAPNKGGAERFRLQRNLKFKSNVSEIYGATEIYPTVWFEQYDGLANKLRPYGVVGIGMFHFNPMGEYTATNGDKKWVELRPLKLEGQGMAEYPDRKPYPLTQMCVEMGGGFKFYITDNVYIGFEILHRKTFTDYIDDVSKKYIDPRYFDTYLTPEQSAYAHQLEYRENLINPAVSRRYINTQRGDPKENDAFFSSILRCGWRLGGNAMSNLSKKQLKCPVFY
jgi:hypothetical protein